ncbi:MAG: ABC transporter substrate-binding protein [Gammaproteobacteria bacterium]|nr:ABC transporter substrate-binding protein [Gammaproteobacteria bacterium]
MNSCYRLATLGLAIGLFASSSAMAQTSPQKELTVVSWGGSYTRSQMLAYVEPYRQERREWVSMETYNGGLKEIREQVETANVVWDVVDFELSDLIRGCREGLLEKIDHRKLAAGSDGTSVTKDFIPGALTECGVGQTVWATVIGYNNKGFKGGRPTRLADFFDVQKFPGKRGLRRDPRVVMEWALMADGVAPNRVYQELETEAGQARAFAILDKIKTSIVWWAAGSEPVELLDAGTVVMTSVWNGRMYRPIVEDGKDYTVLWDGQIWDIDSWGIPKGTYNLKKALDFIRFATESRQLAEQTKYISYGPARKSSLPLVGNKVKAMLPTAPANMRNALQTNAEWWATHQAEFSEKFEQWLAKGGRGLSGSAR